MRIGHRKLVLAAVALLAIGLGVGIASFARDGGSAPDATRPPPTVELISSFGAETGPDGHSWSWIGDSGGLVARGRGRYWLTFRARSIRRKRRLVVRDPQGQRDSAEIGKRAATHVVGPFRLEGRVPLGLQPVPGPTRASRRDPRSLSIFLSDVRPATQPIAASPTSGFYATEYLSPGHPFNWLARRGTVELATNDASVRRVWLRFRAASVDVARPLSVRGAGVVKRLTVPSRGSRKFTVGPFRLRANRLRVTMKSNQARRYGGDPRFRSLRVDDLKATSRPTATAP